MWSISRTMPSTVALCVLSALSLPANAAAAAAAAHDHNHTTAQSSNPAHPAPRDTAIAAMHDMEAMHAKWMAAKTPAERTALMADHFKAMQEGMAVMQRQHLCCGNNAGKLTAAMQMRMDMMAMMMQMMMDRQQMMGGGGMGAMTGSPAPTAAEPSVPPANSPAKP